MKKKYSAFKCVFSLVFIISLTNLYSGVVLVNDADYLIITHPQLEEEDWKNDLISIIEGKGFKVGWKSLEDLSENNEDIRTIISSAYNESAALRFVLLICNGMNLPPTENDPNYIFTRSQIT